MRSSRAAHNGDPLTDGPLLDEVLPPFHSQQDAYGRFGSVKARITFASTSSPCSGRLVKVASPFVVYERSDVSSVAGSLLLLEASETATAGPQGPSS